MTEKKDQFPVEFGDREITFNQPSEGQIAVLARAVRKANRGGPAVIDGVALILDIIDNLVVDPEDRNFLEDGLINDTITLNDFIGVLDGMNAGREDRAKPVANASRARSGRR